MDFIIALVIGGLIGWVASIVMKTNAQMGLIANVVVGIVGAILGHWLAPKLGIASGDTFVYYAVSVGGAVLLIVLLKALKIFK
jgi:uncharacterized membrane protein YeaQ/YmgE (transglycosylase-associated protein family)